MGLVRDMGREEFGDLEMIGRMIYKLRKDARGEEVGDGGVSDD